MSKDIVSMYTVERRIAISTPVTIFGMHAACMDKSQVT